MPENTKRKQHKVYVRRDVVHVTVNSVLYAPRADRDSLRETAAKIGSSYEFAYSQDRDARKSITTTIDGVEETWVPVDITKTGAVDLFQTEPRVALPVEDPTPPVDDVVTPEPVHESSPPIETEVSAPEPRPDPDCFDGLHVINAKAVAIGLKKERAREPRRLAELAECLIEANPDADAATLAPALHHLARSTYTDAVYTALRRARVKQEEQRENDAKVSEDLHA